jgi:hypothetical protein
MMQYLAVMRRCYDNCSRHPYLHLVRRAVRRFVPPLSYAVHIAHRGLMLLPALCSRVRAQVASVRACNYAENQRNDGRTGGYKQ